MLWLELKYVTSVARMMAAIILMKLIVSKYLIISTIV